MKRKAALLKTTNNTRRGAAMIFALVALTAASSIIAILLRTASLSHRQFQRQEFQAQSSLLADSGIARALAKLRAHPEFTGEVWNVPAEQLSLGRTAVVQLKVADDPQKPDQRIVSAVSEFPSSQPDAVKISREISIPKAN